LFLALDNRSHLVHSPFKQFPVIAAMLLPFGYSVNTKKFPMSNLFSDRLKALRGCRKKAEFARLLGVSAPDYQRYENGRMPRADVLSVISKRLNMTVDQLLSGNDPPIAPSCVYPLANTGAAEVREPPPCAGCAARDAEIAELRMQVGMLIRANAALSTRCISKPR
jgi:transcriptional regulator with XRE-family HTH domain